VPIYTSIKDTVAVELAVIACMLVASITGTTIESPAARGNPSVVAADVPAVTPSGPTYTVTVFAVLAIICTPLLAFVVTLVIGTAVVPIEVLLPVKNSGTAAILKIS